MTAPDAHSGLTADQLVAGRYRLVRHVATGGMADVWEGVDDVLTRAVAVKVLRVHLAADREFQERFRREAIAAARLSHPAIVATYDAGIDDGVTYIVMELVRGRTLADVLKAQGPLPPAAVANVAIQVCGALAHAHSAGIWHRDVKPSNILLCDDIAPGRVKIADFGIAKAAGTTDPDLTQAGVIVGTARYLAPEQLDGGNADARSDLYSLGAVLFEMLAGRPPFDGPTDLAIALAHAHDAPPRPRRLRPGIPKPLEAITLRLLAKDPTARFQSADDVRQALESIDLREDDAESTPPPIPTPPGGVSVGPRPARRPRAPMIVVGAIAMIAVVAIAVVVRQTGPRETASGSSGSSAPLVITQAKPFDPEGDRRENDAQAQLAIDGDAGTAWESDRYRTRTFGNLKKGVGLVFLLDSPAQLGALNITSSTEDWAASVYVASSDPADLAGWGEVVEAKQSLAGQTRFDLGGRKGSAVLLWITDPGSQNRASVAEAAVAR